MYESFSHYNYCTLHKNRILLRIPFLPFDFLIVLSFNIKTKINTISNMFLCCYHIVLKNDWLNDADRSTKIRQYIYINTPKYTSNLD